MTDDFKSMKPEAVFFLPSLYRADAEQIAVKIRRQQELGKLYTSFVRIEKFGIYCNNHFAWQ